MSNYNTINVTFACNVDTWIAFGMNKAVVRFSMSTISENAMTN